MIILSDDNLGNTKDFININQIFARYNGQYASSAFSDYSLGRLWM